MSISHTKLYPHLHFEESHLVPTIALCELSILQLVSERAPIVLAQAIYSFTYTRLQKNLFVAQSSRHQEEELFKKSLILRFGLFNQHLFISWHYMFYFLSFRWNWSKFLHGFYMLCFIKVLIRLNHILVFYVGWSISRQ